MRSIVPGLRSRQFAIKSSLKIKKGFKNKRRSPKRPTLVWGMEEITDNIDFSETNGKGGELFISLTKTFIIALSGIACAGYLPVAIP